MLNYFRQGLLAPALWARLARKGAAAYPAKFLYGPVVQLVERLICPDFVKI